MRVIMISLLVFFACYCLAQEPVTGEGDRGLEALMNKVEGQAEQGDSKKVTNEFKAEEGKSWQTEAATMAEAYYSAILGDDLIAVYEMMSKDYRKAVSLQNFLKKDRVRLESVQIKNLVFGGDHCARVSGITKGVASNRMGAMDIPIKLRIFKEDGKWVAFSNPYKLMGMTLPQSKSIKYPCDL